MPDAVRVYGHGTVGTGVTVGAGDVGLGVGFGEGLGKKFASGQASLAELAAAAAAVPAGGEKPPKSGKHERLESVFNAFALG